MLFVLLLICFHEGWCSPTANTDGSNKKPTDLKAAASTSSSTVEISSKGFPSAKSNVRCYEESGDPINKETQKSEASQPEKSLASLLERPTEEEYDQGFSKTIRHFLKQHFADDIDTLASEDSVVNKDGKSPNKKASSEVTKPKGKTTKITVVSKSDDHLPEFLRDIYKPSFDFDTHSSDVSQQKSSNPYWKGRSNYEITPSASKRMDNNGCRTVIKEIKEVPVGRRKRNAGKVKSVIMTKECHFPEDSSQGGIDRSYNAPEPNYEKPPQRQDRSRKIKAASQEKPRHHTPSGRRDENGGSGGYDEPSPYGYSAGSNYSPYRDYRSSFGPQESYSGGRGSEVRYDEPYYGSYTRDSYAPSDDYGRGRFNYGFSDFEGPVGGNRNYGPQYGSNYGEGPESSPVHHKQAAQQNDRNYRPQYSSNYEEGPEPAPVHHKQAAQQNERNYRPQYSSNYEEGHEPSPVHHNQQAAQQNERNYRTHQGGGFRPSKGKQAQGPTKKPKTSSKSYAYYRKDKDKDDDPNNKDYSEEYAHGNYKSYSTDYDSARDGPKH